MFKGDAEKKQPACFRSSSTPFNTVPGWSRRTSSQLGCFCWCFSPTIWGRSAAVRLANWLTVVNARFTSHDHDKSIFGRGPTTTPDPLGEQQPNQYGYFKHVSIRPGMISSKPPMGGNAMTRSLRWVAQVDDFWRLALGRKFEQWVWGEWRARGVSVSCGFCI